MYNLDVMNTLFLGGDVRTRPAGELKYATDQTAVWWVIFY
jgi:hypothetical protein